jgi:hypothetical protein
MYNCQNNRIFNIYCFTNLLFSLVPIAINSMYTQTEKEGESFKFKYNLLLELDGQKLAILPMGKKI